MSGRRTGERREGTGSGTTAPLEHARRPPTPRSLAELPLCCGNGTPTAQGSKDLRTSERPRPGEAAPDSRGTPPAYPDCPQRTAPGPRSGAAHPPRRHTRPPSPDSPAPGTRGRLEQAALTSASPASGRRSPGSPSLPGIDLNEPTHRKPPCPSQGNLEAPWPHREWCQTPPPRTTYSPRAALTTTCP